MNKNIVICTSPRSGSQWLSECIRLGGLGKCAEWMAEDIVNGRKHPTLNFPLVLHGWLAARASKYINWNNVTVVYLRRLDIDAQAVSWFRAIIGKRWNSDFPEDSLSFEHYNFHRIMELRSSILEYRSVWQLLFKKHNIKPIKVSYERLAGNWFEMVNLIERLGGKIDPNGPSPHQKIQRDNLNRKWLERFRQEVKAGYRIEIPV